MNHYPNGPHQGSPQPGQQPFSENQQRDPWKLAAGWVDASGSPMRQQEAAARMRRYRPHVLKQLLAWSDIAVGVLIAVISLAMLFDQAFNLWESLGFIVFALLISLPGLYWVRRTRQDRVTVTEWTSRIHQNQQMRQYLQGPELELLANSETTPLLPQRRWGRVILAQFGLFILFFIIVAFGF